MWTGIIKKCCWRWSWALKSRNSLARQRVGTEGGGGAEAKAGLLEGQWEGKQVGDSEARLGKTREDMMGQETGSPASC